MDRLADTDPRGGAADLAAGRDGPPADAGPAAGASAPAELTAAQTAAKLARMVVVVAAQIAEEPERKGRLGKLRRLMAEADALAGAGATPGEPALDAIGSAGYHQALAAFYLRQRMPAAAAEAAAAAAAADPLDLAIRGLWLESLRVARRLDEVPAVLDIPGQAADGPGRAAMLDLLRRAEGLANAAGDSGLAISALERAVALSPSDSRLARRLAGRAEAEGDLAKAQEIRARLRGSWLEQLPPRLAEGLRDLRPAAALRHPEAALAWAWALADKEAWRRDDWLQALDWGPRATKLLVKWWSARPEAADEIAALTDPPDLGPLRAAQASGRPQVLASSHFGPLPAAILFLERSGLPFRTLGGDGLDQLTGGRKTLIPVGVRAAASRELIHELRRGAVLAIAADSPTEDDRVELDFLRRRIALKSLPARLAQRRGCDTWWYQPLWRGDRIVIELERLPDPRPDEPEQEWTLRWSRAYLKRLKRIMRGDPRNLVLDAGVWRYAWRVTG